MSWNSFLSCLQRVNDISHDLVHSIRNSHNNPDSLAAQLGLITASKNFIPVSNNLLSFHHDFMWLEITLRENCLYSELFCSAFPSFGLNTERYVRISHYSVQMRENADQNNSEYVHFLRSVTLISIIFNIVNSTVSQHIWYFGF